MKGKTLLYPVVDGLGHFLAAVWRPLQPVWSLGGRFVRLVYLRSVCKGKIPVTTQFDGRIDAIRGSRLTLGEHCRLGDSVVFETVGSGRIEIGSDVRINCGCLLVSYERICIGSYTLIGEYVSIRDANHGIGPEGPIQLQPHESASITIEEDVWIGRGAVILKGVTIGKGAIVGANSVVNKSVPSYTIVAGAPAKHIGCRG